MITKQEDVFAAEKNLFVTNIQKQKRVQEVAGISCVGIKTIRKIENAPVYNMEVEDNHNFAIENGLIVHNCMDATRYFVKSMRIAVPKRQGTAYLL